MSLEAGSNAEINPEMLERRINEQLDTLPSGIRATWQKELDDLSDDGLPAFNSKLRSFIGNREKALIGKSTQMFEGVHHMIKDQEAISKTLNVIYEAEGNPELYVGEGKTAHVYRNPKIPNICYKYVKDFREYEEWNSVDKEAKFLEELGGINVNGVRVPALNGVIDLPETKVIEMELIDAPSLDKVFLNRRQLPDDFDTKIFFKKLRDFVEAMHQRHVYHRDLHEGNVLVGKDNTPYVIDFGRAEYSVSPDFAYDVYDRTGSNKIVLSSDEAWVDLLEAKVQKHRSNKKLAKS